MRSVLAACLLVLFATQMATDAVACPDECRQASTQASDCCGTSGGCVFCGAGAVLFAAADVVAHISLSLPVAEPDLTAPPRSTTNVPDRPPRVA